MHNQTETETAYLAGILDGEGTIQVAMHREKKRGRPTYFRAEVYVTNTNMRLLEWIRQRFGGTIGRARRKDGKNWKPVYRLHFPSGSIELLLQLVLPYLVVKQRLAELAIELRRRLRTYEHPLSVEERAQRYALFVEARELNKRGINDAERLSEATPRKEDDTIVRSAANEEAAEAGRNVQPAVVH